MFSITKRMTRFDLLSMRGFVSVFPIVSPGIGVSGVAFSNSDILHNNPVRRNSTSYDVFIVVGIITG